jgi:YfiH family protein
MQATAPFRAAGEHLAIDLDGAAALFTTRRGGVSDGPYASLNLGRMTGDEEPLVAANRELLAGELGIAWARFALARQVHGTRVLRHSQPPGRATGAWPEADGHATALAGVPALVFVADCLPIALATPGAVAMLHGGWRGLAGGIVEEGVRALREVSGDHGGPLRAAIGPGIGPCCFEVGDEVREAFAQHGAEVRDGRNVDLKLVARRRLEEAGAVEVHDAEVCTACHPELFFSHRRDAGVTGRQAGVVWRRA